MRERTTARWPRDSVFNGPSGGTRTGCGGSPTVYIDDATDSYLVQGWKVLDEARLAVMDIPSHETVVEIPRRMVQFFLEVQGGEGPHV